MLGSHHSHLTSGTNLLGHVPTRSYRSLACHLSPGWDHSRSHVLAGSDPCRPDESSPNLICGKRRPHLRLRGTVPRSVLRADSGRVSLHAARTERVLVLKH